MPRIIAGKARGISLAAPAGLDTRPTADKTKEALFSILTPRIADARLLDLFAGTGQIGLEALSRGAAEAVMVENDRQAMKAIAANIAKTHLSEGARMLSLDAAKAVRLLADEGRTFNLVFLDPPYAVASASLLKIAPILTAGLLTDDGLVILEHASDSPAPKNVTNLQLTRSCKYGAAMLSFYKYIPQGMPQVEQTGENQECVY